MQFVSLISAEEFFQGANIINNVLMTFIGVSFIFTLLFLCVFFFPKKKFKKATNFHRFTVMIKARNEEKMIAETIESIRHNKYDQSLVQIIVLAHNCTDNTAGVAKSLGARVIEINSTEEKTKTAGYAMTKGLEALKDEDHEFFVMLDADNLLDENFLSAYNDACDAGVEVGRCHESTKNFSKNIYSGMAGLWFLRDSRINGRGRNTLHLNTMLFGGGFLLSHNIVKKYGFEIDGLCDDWELTINYLLKDVKSFYIEDAIIYEDQCTSFKENLKRFNRSGAGTIRLLIHKGPALITKFFKSFRLSCIDTLFNLLMTVDTLIFCIWIPLFYGSTFIYKLVIEDYNFLFGPFNFGGDTGFIYNALFALAVFFLIPFIIQGFLTLFLERKVIKVEKWRYMILPALLMPYFMIISSIGISLGVFFKPSWKQVERSGVSTIKALKEKRKDK